MPQHLPTPFVIDNQTSPMAEVLNGLLDQTVGKPLDVATAYFSVSGYRLLQDRLHQVGCFRLLLGSEPQTGADIGLRSNVDVLKWRGVVQLRECHDLRL